MKAQLVKIALFLVFFSTAASANSDTATFDGGESKKAMKAYVFTRKNGQIAISVEKNAGETALLRIISATGEVMYQKKMKHTNQILKQYDLSQLPKGDYTFEISVDRQVYKKQIEVKHQIVKPVVLK